MKLKKEPQRNITLTLEMSLEEAVALKAIVGSVLGSPMGPRAVANSIYDALRDLPHTISIGKGEIEMPSDWKSINKLLDS